MMEAAPFPQLGQHAREAFTRTEQVKAAAAEIAAAAAVPPPPPEPPKPGA